MHSAPGFIMSDQEGAFFSDEWSVWTERWSIELWCKAKGSRAHVVERRNELLRQQYHRLRSQARNDGLNVTPTQLLDES